MENQKHDAHHVLKDMVWQSARALDAQGFIHGINAMVFSGIPDIKKVIVYL